MLHLAALALAPSPILSTRSRLAKPAVGAASSGALAGGPQPPPRSPQDDNSRKQQWIPGGGRAPSYLDGSLAGDRGFDPKCLVVLARTRTRVDSGPWAKIEREARMVRSRISKKKRICTGCARVDQARESDDDQEDCFSIRMGRLFKIAHCLHT
jgi:hypothetical protein